jgi:hypothetical protein
VQKGSSLTRSAPLVADHPVVHGLEQSKRSLRSHRAGSEVGASHARRFAVDLAPTIKDTQTRGLSTLSGIAEESNRRGVRTAGGRGYGRRLRCDACSRGCKQDRTPNPGGDRGVNGQGA